MTAISSNNRDYKVSEAYKNKNIALIGFMGCGKSSVGRVLSLKLNYKFIDCDKEIEKFAGMPITDIFEKHGEAYFRTLEQSFIESIAAVRNTIISTGGGVVKNNLNIDFLRKNSIIIYLKVSPHKIHKNTMHDDSRPLLKAPNKLQRIKELLSEREPLYISSADIVIQSDLTIYRTASKIMKSLRYDGNNKK